MFAQLGTGFATVALWFKYRVPTVDDVGLGFNALGGLPGPFIKHFVDHTGLEACCRMLDGFSDRTALGTCVLGYFDGAEVKLFEGSLRGAIASHPRGGGGY